MPLLHADVCIIFAGCTVNRNTLVELPSWKRTPLPGSQRIRTPTCQTGCILRDCEAHRSCETGASAKCGNPYGSWCRGWLPRACAVGCESYLEQHEDRSGDGVGLGTGRNSTFGRRFHLWYGGRIRRRTMYQVGRTTTHIPLSLNITGLLWWVVTHWHSLPILKFIHHLSFEKKKTFRKLALLPSSEKEAPNLVDTVDRNVKKNTSWKPALFFSWSWKQSRLPKFRVFFF